MDYEQRLNAALADRTYIYGPLPVKWSMHFSQKGNITYWRSGKRYDTHPLTPSFAIEHPGVFKSISVKARPTVFGIQDPFTYKHGDWRWCVSDDGVADAMAVSATAFFAGIGDAKTVCKREVEELAAIITELKDALPDKEDLYNPLDRPSFEVEGILLPKERTAAAVARALGFSLVVVYQDQIRLQDLTVGGQEKSELTQRYSVGENYELHPPLFMGHACGKWFGLRLQDASRYSQFAPHSYSWSTWARQLWDKGLLVDETSFIKITVRLQRLCRVGFPTEALTDKLVIEFANFMLENLDFDELSFLKSWRHDDESAIDSILSYGTVTAAICCAKNDIARESARSFDHMTSIFASLSSRTPTSLPPSLVRAIKAYTFEVQQRPALSRGVEHSSADAAATTFGIDRATTSTDPAPTAASHEVASGEHSTTPQSLINPDQGTSSNTEPQLPRGPKVTERHARDHGEHPGPIDVVAVEHIVYGDLNDATEPDTSDRGSDEAREADSPSISTKETLTANATSLGSAAAAEVRAATSTSSHFPGRADIVLEDHNGSVVRPSSIPLKHPALITIRVTSLDARIRIGNLQHIIRRVMGEKSQCLDFRRSEDGLWEGPGDYGNGFELASCFESRLLRDGLWETPGDYEAR